MPELKSAILYVGIVIGAAAAMVLGDYLGYKVGRKRLAAFAGGVALVCVVGFAVYAAVVLA